MHQRDIIMVAEEGFDLLVRLVHAAAGHGRQRHKSIASPMASWIRIGGHGGINTARQAADHPARADLCADTLDGLFTKGPHGPVAGTSGNVLHEIMDKRGTIGVCTTSGWNWTA